jgi:hypothetical protein
MYNFYYNTAFKQLVRVFISVNVDEDSSGDPSNLDIFLVAHEWLEAWVRIAACLHRHDSNGSPASKHYIILLVSLHEQCGYCVHIQTALSM